MKKLQDIRLLKLYFWLALGFLVFGFLNTISNYPDHFWASVFNNFWGVIFVTVVNFMVFEYLAPFVLKRSSVIYSVLIAIPLLFVLMIVYSYVSYAWRLLGIALHIYTRLNLTAKMGQLLENQMAYSVSSVFFFGIIRHIFNYNRLKQSAQQLRIEKQQAELNYLKSQTNPHFLFNTLNNIYALTRDKSELAPESILRLSKILRYMLYEAGGAYIAVEQELQIISDYIQLEKLRYDEALSVNFNYDVESMKQSVPPLLLIPLVENAFKHGVSETRDSPFVDIHLSIKSRHLTLVVKNSAGDFEEDKPVKENIGLSNLRRQLELLYTDYQLLLQQGKTAFTAILKINLGSHV